MFLNWLIQSCYAGRYYCTLHFDPSLVDLDFDSRSQECKEANISVPVSRQVFSYFEWNMVCCWNLLVWWASTHCSSSIQYLRQRILLVWFLSKTCLFKLRLACIQTFGVMIECTKLYILISVWMTLIVIQGTVVWKIRTLVFFSCKIKYLFGWNSVCCHNLFLEAHARFILHE